MSTPRSATSARDEVREVAPKLIELSEQETAGRIAKKVFEGAK